jgi:hypothetical protein
MKRFNHYNVLLDYEVKDGILSYSGVWVSLKKWISHSFKKDSICFIKDKRNYNKKKAQVIKITEDFITVRVFGNKGAVKLSVEDFISFNYTKKELPLKIKEMLNKHEEESRNGQRNNQPVPQCRSLELFDNWKFAFDSYEQLFNWFTVTEISLLIKNDVKIVNLQEFVDFEKIIYSLEQVVYTNNINSDLYGIF